MTREEFLTHEIYVWGEDYIFNLIDRGYSLINTTGGWRWQLPVRTSTISTKVDTTAEVCYTAPVGVG